MKRIAYYLSVLALAVFAFTSCEDVPSPFGPIVAPKTDDVVVVTPTGSGTEADPYNVTAISEKTKALADGEVISDVYTIGYICQIDEIDTSGSYGNSTYWISDDKDGKTGKFEVYRGYGLGGQKFNEAGATIIKEGDLVVVKGNTKNFKGTTPEYDQGSILVVLNDKTAGGGGGGDTPSGDLGTKDAPLTVAQALAAINKLADGGETGDAYVKGIISKVQSFNATYKSITYYISDNGKETSELQVYSGKGLNGADFAAKEDLAAGDIVVVKGKLKKFVKGDVVTPEINQSSEIISLTKGSGGGGGGGDAKGTGTANDPFNVAAAIAKCKEAGTTATSDIYYVKGIVNAEYTVDSFNNATLELVDSEGSSEIFTAYRVFGPDGAKLKEGYKIPKGATVVVSGKLVNFKGNTPETAQNSGTLVSVNGKAPELEGGSGGGGGESGAAKGSGTEADPFNVAAAIAKCQQVGETASTEKYYIKGIADAEYTVTSYKNVEVDIVDAAGSSDKFKVFRVKDKDGKGIKEGYKIAKGATIIVYGPVVNYKGNTPETATGAYLVSVNGQAPELDGEGGGTSGGGGSAATSLTNGDFETWANGLPTGWKSTSTASSATLAQSTDAHGGKYSCNVNGDESQNKRLASQEITLAAGTYVFSAWIKATTSDVAQARPGYVPIGADGKAGSYAYGDYANLTTSWQQFSYEFTLDSEKTVCLVIMNPKKSSYSSGKDILVDDATLTKK